MTGGDHARRTREHQPADAVLSARGDDILGADDVGQMIFAGRPPDSRLCSNVEDDVAAGDRPIHGVGVRDVSLHLLDAEFVEGRVSLPGKAAHRVAAVAQPPDDGPAQKSAAAGHQGTHDAVLLQSL